MNSGEFIYPFSQYCLFDKSQEQHAADEQKKGSDNGKELEKVASKHQPSVSNIPRLISVVEIIKREYLRDLPQSLTKAGLYQYNRIGSLEEADAKQEANNLPTEADRAQEILMALSGSNNLKIQKTPYLQILLSVKPPEGFDKTWSHQEPLTQKLSRSSRYRFNKRQKKGGEANVQAMETDGDAEDKS